MIISAVGNIGAVQAADNFIVGFIGGSITDGQGVSVENRYSTLVVNNYFKQKYKDKNVIERNASIPGTGSAYGVMRMEKDLGLDTENTPDVVFVEFSVNDAGAIDQTIINNMESIVRRLALLPKAPSIVFLYSAAYHSTKFGYTGWGSEAAGSLEYTIDAASKVAKNYGIYEINFNEYVWEGIQSGKWQWDKTKPDETLSNDELHPNVKGHKVYADMIVDCLKKDESKAFAKPNSDARPIANYVYGRFTNVPLSDESVKLSSGWKKVAASPPSDDSTYTMSREYKDGYIETDDCVGETIEYEFTGRGVGIDKFSYTKNEALLSWAVYDEKGNIEKSGEYSDYSKNGGGARCYGRILANNLPYGKHKLVITGKKNQTAADDSESSGGKEGGTGTFLRIGYIAVESEMPVVLPLAKNVSLSEANGVYTGTYEYDGWKYAEGETECGWYVADRHNGRFAFVASGAEFTPSSLHYGKYIKFAVTPVNKNGDRGRTVYSSVKCIGGEIGTLSFGSKISVMTNGTSTYAPGTGENSFTADIENSGMYAASVIFVAATYKTVGEYKVLTGKKLTKKNIAAGSSESFTVDITAAETDSEIKIYAINTDSAEPIIPPRGDIDYLEAYNDGDAVITAYRINQF